MTVTSVLPCVTRLTESCGLRTNGNSTLLVYPETKGVPLEEMDRVFGEGNFAFVLRRIC